MNPTKLLWAGVLLCAACGLTGCARHYVITLNNGATISTHGKPRLKGSIYVFKDRSGKPAYVPAGRVTEIAPASMVGNPAAKFGASGK